MKSIKKHLFITGFFVLASINVYSQMEIQKLPEYVIITAENTKLLGGIGLMIDYKKSPYRAELIRLEEYLTLAKQNRVRTQTDLLNVMSAIGFEYINAFNANAGTIGGNTDIGDRSEVGLSESKFRINMVFRKKEKYRNE